MHFFRGLIPSQSRTSEERSLFHQGQKGILKKSTVFYFCIIKSDILPAFITPNQTLAAMLRTGNNPSLIMSKACHSSQAVIFSWQHKIKIQKMFLSWGNSRQPPPPPPHPNIQLTLTLIDFNHPRNPHSSLIPTAHFGARLSSPFCLSSVILCDFGDEIWTWQLCCKGAANIFQHK